MTPRAKVGQASDLPHATVAKPGRSKTRPTSPRELAISKRHPRLKIPRGALARVISVLDENAADFRGGCASGELSLVFLTDPALAKIHADFMDDPTATDVITFEGDRAAGLAGEICVSVDTAGKYVGLPSLDKLGTLSPSKRLVGRPASARRQAPALHKTSRSGGSPTLQNRFAAELTLYVVHGWLHLAGYDDLRPAEKRKMRAAEARAMKLLRSAKVVPEFRLK